MFWKTYFATEFGSCLAVIGQWVLATVKLSDTVKPNPVMYFFVPILWFYHFDNFEREVDARIFGEIETSEEICKSTAALSVSVFTVKKIEIKLLMIFTESWLKVPQLALA